MKYIIPLLAVLTLSACVANRLSEAQSNLSACLNANPGTMKPCQAELQEYNAAYAERKTTRRAAQPLPYSGFPGAVGGGQTVYSPSQCTGPIVAGVCHGGIIPNPALQKTCHGEMLNGTCTGPMF